MGKLSHIDSDNRPTMVDVSDKTATQRAAHARAIVQLPEEIARHIDGDEIAARRRVGTDAVYIPVDDRECLRRMGVGNAKKRGNKTDGADQPYRCVRE